MAAEPEPTTRKQLYDKYNVSFPGRYFVAYLLPMLERSIGVQTEVQVDLREEVLAEIALWKAFDETPKIRPYAIIGLILLAYDYLYFLQFEFYGLFIVTLATLMSLISGLRSRYHLAAEYAGSTNDGIPTELLFGARNVASNTVTLTFIAIGILVQMTATANVVGSELIGTNLLAGSSVPSFVVILAILIGLFARKPNRA